MPLRLIAAVTLCACAITAQAAPLWPLADQQLLHNARFWEAHDRGDLAQLALQKLVAARPDLPDALLELGELDLRLNEFTAANDVESELARRFPDSAAAKHFTTEVRIATRDRLKFASVQRLIEVGRAQQARTQLEALFPDGPPGGSLGIDYYRLLARTPHGLEPATQGMRRLAQQHGNDPRYQFALAQFLVHQGDLTPAEVTFLQQLAQRDDVRREDAERLLASGLLRLGPERAPPTAVSLYLKRHPEDQEVVALQSEQQRLSEERELLSSATLSQAVPELQRRLARDLSGPTGSQGRREARAWLDRSRASLAAHQERQAATELRAALAFERGADESEIAIARDLESQGLAPEAGELLADAARLDPKSTWLFETRVRWLLAHGDSATAIELVRGRSPTPKWGSESRDQLLASALEARATAEANAARPEAAMADLEAAVPLAPHDPWLRYRLAEYYRSAGDAERGRRLMSEGVQVAPDLPDMRYAQGLYLEHLEDYPAAYAAIDGIDAAQRTDGMNALRDRMQVAEARASARRLQQAGDLAGARAALLAAEPAASHSFDRATELAYSWIALGSSAHGLDLVRPYLEGPGANDAQRVLGWAQVLNSAEDDASLRTALAQLRSLPQLSAAQRLDAGRLQRALDLREIRALERGKQYAEAGRRLDALLAADPHDRQLRVMRAELDLMAARPRAARDRLASLVAEDPDDLDARLSYVRALTESGDIALARAQLAAVEARTPTSDEELEIGLARRQLALGAPAKALRTLEPLLAAPHPRTDVLMLAGRAELALNHLAKAHEYFEQAATGATAADDVLAARHASEDAENRLQSSVTAGALVWHQPGSPGMSQLDAVTLPSSWLYARDDGSRFIARADAVWLDAGRWDTSPESLPLLGTLQAAGADAPLRYTDDRQAGVSPGVGYQTASLAGDIGATPLGFLLPNVVGGVEWTPTWQGVDLTLGLARRAVTSSELSYAGLRDPVTGTAWGAVVQTGPYAGFGIYRENYDLSGSVRFEEITGHGVPDNQLAAAHWSSSWKFLSRQDLRADAGVTLDYWNYERNLSNYTFGSGGYYSPQSYVSLSTPLELAGTQAGWAYKLRAGVSYTISQVSSAAFYPDDAALQAQAAREPLPSGYTSPYFSGYHSSGFGFSLYAATERQLTRALVVGFMADIDRTDYYHPTSIGIYVRHAFGPWETHGASPPRPVSLYNP